MLGIVSVVLDCFAGAANGEAVYRSCGFSPFTPEMADGTLRRMGYRPGGPGGSPSIKSHFSSSARIAPRAERGRSGYSWLLLALAAPAVCTLQK